MSVRLKLLKALPFPGGYVPKGEEIALPSRAAERLVAAGWARPIVEKAEGERGAAGVLDGAAGQDAVA